jgi:hypothetical protein
LYMCYCNSCTGECWYNDVRRAVSNMILRSRSAFGIRVVAVLGLKPGHVCE